MINKDVVLVVEDEPLVRDSIVLELEDAGFEVMSAYAPQPASKVEGSVFLAKPYRVDEILNASEELKSRNEDLFSINEELRFTNEELEASRDELQGG